MGGVYCSILDNVWHFKWHILISYRGFVSLKSQSPRKIDIKMAEGQGFEPWVGVNPRWFSRPVLSTAQPPLQKEGEMIPEIFFESIY